MLGLSDGLVKHALAYFTIRDDGGAHRPAGVLRLGTPDMTPSAEGRDSYRERLPRAGRAGDVVETDLRLAVNEGLDRLVLDGLAGSGFQAPATDNILVSVRKAMTTILAGGYNPDTLVLTPANSEAIDTMVSGVSGATADFVFGPGRFAPGTLFGLNIVISKTTASPVVLDSRANGRLYVSPIALARFEVDSGITNRSNIRLEGHGAYGVERTAAAVRIAAS